MLMCVFFHCYLSLSFTILSLLSRRTVEPSLLLLEFDKVDDEPDYENRYCKHNWTLSHHKQLGEKKLLRLLVTL